MDGTGVKNNADKEKARLPVLELSRH
jgi:hypothetical protein